jgi:hypothetical protein
MFIKATAQVHDSGGRKLDLLLTGKEKGVAVAMQQGSF